MSFWNFLNFAQTSKINSKLSEPGTTLEDLLADDSIITEFKSLNPKLLDFCTDTRVKRMLSYIIEEPPQDADRDRGYKYPFVSCEVLTADVETLLEAFFGRNPNNLKRDSAVSESSREGVHSDLSGDRSQEEDHEDHEGEEEKPSNNGETSPEKADKEQTENQESPKKEDENKEETAEEKKEENIEESPEKAPKDESVEAQEKSQEQEHPEEPVEKLQPDELPNYFFSFLDGEKLNETLVGYFARFLNHLILRKENDIYKYVWEHPEVIDKLIAHVDMRGLAECLSKLFLLEPSHQPDEFKTIKSEKLRQLAQVLNKEESTLDSDALNQTALIFNEILSKKSTLHNKHFIESYIYSKDFLDTLFNNLGRHPTLSPHIASIINTLLTTYLQKDDHNVSHDDEDEPKKDDTKPEEEIDYNILNTSLASAAGYIVQTLQGQSDIERATTYGGAQRPLGLMRLRIVEMVLNIIRLNVHDVSLELAKKGVFKALMDLMVQYEWNNMLHNFVEKILVSTLESEFHDVRDKLLNESDLLGFLAANTEEVNYTMPNAQKRKLRRGYLGQITRIAKLLERLGEVDTTIKEYLNNDKWNKFKEEYLTVTLENDNKDLAKSAHRESEDFADNYLEGALGGHGNRNDNEDGAGEDDINDRDDDAREGHDFTNNDIFNKFGSQFEEWGSEEQHGESHAENKDFWSMSPSDFSTTFKFGAFPGLAQEENAEEANKYLGLNRKLEVIDIGPQHDEKLEQAYFDNAFWAKPKDTEHNIDDILKEFECH